MKCWNGLQMVSAGVFVISLLGLTVINGGLPWKAALALLAAAAVTLLVREAQNREEADSHRNLIRMMNRYRHDWMNELQVLFGYIRLQKYEKMQEYMDKLNAKAHEESYLSKLGVPSLIVFFYSFGVGQPAFQLEVEIEREIPLSRLPLRGHRVSRLIQQTVRLFESRALSADGEPNGLNLALDMEDDTLLLDFVYRGAYARDQAEEELARICRAYAADLGGVEQEWAEQKAAVTMRLPFQQQ